MSRSLHHSHRGSLTLAVMCFVAVLGIGLASYLALSTQSLKFSNRSARTGYSRQLSEVGIEEAMRAFNKNLLSGTDTTAALADWTSSGVSANWTLNTTTKRATAAISFPATKFGQGVTGSVKIRVDNYDAAQLGSAWVTATAYRINDLVGYSGIWYRCVKNHTSSSTNQPPHLTFWVPYPIPWTWSKDNAATNDSSDTSYSLYDLVNYNGVWYRCILAVASGTANSTPALRQTWFTGTNYTKGDLVISSGTLYRCTGNHFSSAAFATDASSWSASPTIYWMPILSAQPWNTSVTYNQYDVVNYNGVQYRCLSTHMSSPLFSTDSANWDSNVRPLSLPWTGGGAVYSRGAIVFLNGIWYFCWSAGTSSTAPNLDTAMWAPIWNDSSGTAPVPGVTWVSSTKYFVGDYVYNGGWYRCITDNTDATWDSAKWVSALPYITWIYRSITPPFNGLVYYGGGGSGLWYRYVGWWDLALTGSMHTWSNGSIKYNLGDVVYYSSTSQWYRCILAHTSSGSLTPSSTIYWADTPLRSNQWEPNRQYSQYDTVLYNGAWYLSLQNSNYAQIPTAASSSYWVIAPSSLSVWDSTKNYGANEVVSYSGTWYRCILAPTSNQNPTDTTYWSIATGVAYQWDSATTYATGNYRSHGGVWYQCLSGNTGQSPNNTTYWSAVGAPVVYTEGTLTLPDGSTTKTQLRATIAPASLFPNAAAATTALTVTGGTAGTVDSYDGAVNTMDTGGTYTTKAYGGSNIGYSAVLAASGTASPSLTVGNNTDVKGYVAALSASSTPYAPLASFGGSATVKSAASAVSPSVDTTRVSRSPHIPQFDTLPSPSLSSAFGSWNFPMGTSIPATTTTLNLGTPGATTPSRYYYSGGSFYLGTGGSGCVTLNINGPVILYINGSLRINSGGKIEIRGSGSLEIHCTYLRTSSTTDGIWNRTLDPKRLIVIGDTTNSTASYLDNGNGTNNRNFYGVYYAPNTTSALGFQVLTGMTVYGAISAKNVYFNNEANLHYDTSLRYATFGGVDQPYAVTEWRELDSTEQATMP